MLGYPGNPYHVANYFTEMSSGSEAGSYLRLMDFVYHSTLGVRVIKKKSLLSRARNRLGQTIKTHFGGRVGGGGALGLGVRSSRLSGLRFRELGFRV